MLEQFFISNPDVEKSTPIRPRKAVIIGAGQVGMACAYSLIIQDCFDILILQDINIEKTEGEVMDLMHGISFIAPTEIQAGTIADEGKNADLVIITAGATQKPGESRLNLLERNIVIFKSFLGDVVKYCPDAILLIVSNPVDIMTYVTWKMTGFSRGRIVGTGTVLDTARFRALLGQKLDIDPRSVHAYIIGEHGDSEVPVWSTANVAGMKLCPQGWDSLSLEAQQELDNIFGQVKNAAYEIIQRKGYTNYAIGLAVTDIVKAILKSQERVLTVSSRMEGIYGIDDVCLSWPRVVGEFGILKTVKLTLNEIEQQQLQNSAQILRAVFDKVQISALS